MPHHPNGIPLDSYGRFEARLSRGDWSPQIVFIDTEGNEFALCFVGGAAAVEAITRGLCLEAAALNKMIRTQGWLDLWSSISGGKSGDQPRDDEVESPGPGAQPDR